METVVSLACSVLIAVGDGTELKVFLETVGEVGGVSEA